MNKYKAGDKVIAVKPWSAGDWLKVGDVCTVKYDYNGYGTLSVCLHDGRVGGFSGDYFEPFGLASMSDEVLASEYRRLAAEIKKVFDELERRGFHLYDDEEYELEHFEHVQIKKIETTVL